MGRKKKELAQDVKATGIPPTTLKKLRKVVEADKSEYVTPQPRVIFQYIRKNNSQEPRGVMAAVANDSNFSLGFSLVNKAAGDRFDKSRGVTQAIRRAERNLKRGCFTVEVPPSILESMEHFNKRAKSYFKDKKEVVWSIAPQTPNLTSAEQDELQQIFTPDFADTLLKSLNKDSSILPKTLLNIIDRQAKKNLATT